MFWLALLVVGGFAVYAMHPEERARVAGGALRILGDAWGAFRTQRGVSDPFCDALDGRTRAPFLTWTVVFLNLAIFVLMLAGPGRLGDPATLVNWGGSIAPLTTNAQWWRLLTAPFVHAGVLQLVVDMAALWEAAILVERMLGHGSFAGIYLVSAMLPAAIALSADPMTVSTGASGGVFGVYGLLLAVAIHGLRQRSPLTIPLRVLKRLAPAAAIFVLYYMATSGGQWTSGLLALAAGGVVGLVLARDVAERKPPARRVVALVTIVLVIIAATAAPMRGTADARPEIARLIAVEDRTARDYQAAVEQFRLGAIKAQALAQLIERSIIPELQTARTRLEAIRGVTREQKPLVEGAEEYLRLRRESWQLRATALHKSNMRLLRDADAKERASLDTLEKIRPAIGSAKS